MSFLSVLARLSLVGAVAGAVFGAAPMAHAARVAVLVPLVDSPTKFTDGKRNKFHDTLTKGLQDEAGVSTTVIGADEVRQKLGNHTVLSECESGPCLSQVATKLSADRLVVARVGVKSAVGGSAYTIELSVFDQAGTALAMHSSEKCGDDSDGCNLTRAFETLRRASANIAGMMLAEKAPPPKPPEQTTPPPRPPELQLKDPNAPEAMPPSMGVPQQPLPPTQPPPQWMTPVTAEPYSPRYKYGWIAALAAGGALTIIASAPFLYYASLENQTNCGPNVQRQLCPQVYKGNLGPGLGILISGTLVTAGTFGVLFYLDRREQRRARPTALTSIRNAGDAPIQLAGE